MSTSPPRAVVESPAVQGANESVLYSLTTTVVGPAPTSVACFAYDMADQRTPVDVSGAVLTGTASVVGDVITAPALHGLVRGHRYRLVWRWQSGGNTFERYLDIVAEL